jgi:DNA-binding transcriptional regulator YhcF (GntR family)
MEEFVHSANLQILGQEKGEGNGSVSRCGNLLLKYKEVLLTEYQLEIKQIVEYPRCRIQKKFVEMLMCDPDIKTSGGCGLYHYTVLSSFVRFETTNRKISGVNYTVFPGELLCTMDELFVLLRAKSKYQALSILMDLQRRHFIEFNILDDGNCVKYRIKDWEKFNRAMDAFAPCHEDKGYFYLPTSVVSNLIGRRHLSEMDAFLDLWLNTVYDDNRVQSSVVDPVVYMRNETGKPTLDCGQLAKRWNVSASTAEKYLQKLKNNGYIYYKETIGENGWVVYLGKELTSMFRVSDVLLDKEEIPMKISVKLELKEEELQGGFSKYFSAVEADTFQRFAS